TLGPILGTYVLRKLEELIAITVKAENDPGAELRLLRESLCAYRKPHPLDTHIEFNVRTPKETPLIFPDKKYDEVADPSLRLILLTIDDLEDICDKLLDQIKVSLF